MQLVYRAASYTFQPVAPALRPTAIAASSPQGSPTLQTLLYRGQVYHYCQAVSQPISMSHTLNWRFSQVCKAQDPALAVAHA